MSNFVVTYANASRLYDNAAVCKVSPTVSQVKTAIDRAIAVAGTKKGCSSCRRKANTAAMVESMIRSLDAASQFEIDRIKQVLNVEKLIIRNKGR